MIVIDGITLAELVQSLGGAILFATIYYVKNRRKKKAKFDPGRYIATLLLSLVVWGGAIVAGDTITQGSLQAQLLMYSGAIALLDGVITAIFRGKPVLPAIVEGLNKYLTRGKDR